MVLSKYLKILFTGTIMKINGSVLKNLVLEKLQLTGANPIICLMMTMAKFDQISFFYFGLYPLNLIAEFGVYRSLTSILHCGILLYDIR